MCIIIMSESDLDNTGQSGDTQGTVPNDRGQAVVNEGPNDNEGAVPRRL